MIDKRDGFSRKAPKTQDSYFNDAPAMPNKSNVPASQKKAPDQVTHDK